MKNRKKVHQDTMLRRYTADQAVEKLGVDDAELRFLLLHFRECLSMPGTRTPSQGFSENDLQLLARAFRLVHEEGQDPSVVRAAMHDELSGCRASGFRQPTVLAFCSGGDGTGKTSLVRNIAAALAARGARITIFDGLLTDDDSPDFLPVETSHRPIQTLEPGVNIISGKMILHADREAELAELNSLSDFILVDAGSGISDNALRYAMVVDETVLITTPDVESNTNCFSVIRMLKDADPDLPVSILLNRVASVGVARESFARINGAAVRLGMGEIAGFGWVAEDDAFRRCMAQGDAVVTALPASASAMCIARIADNLTNRLSPTKRNNDAHLSGLVQALRSAMERQSSEPEPIKVSF